MPKWMFNLGARRSKLAEYPACDHLNHALNFLLTNPEENRLAIEEICYAIIKAGGYFHNHVAEGLVMYGFGSFVPGVKICG